MAKPMVVATVTFVLALLAGCAATPAGNTEAGSESLRVLVTEDEWVSAEINRDEATLRRVIDDRIAGGPAPLARSWIGVTLALCGEGARARQVLAELRSLEKKQYVDPVSFAAIEGALGDVGGAMRSYEKAFEDRKPNMVYAAMAPAFSPEVVPLPRYRAIVERMGFPKLPGRG